MNKQLRLTKLLESVVEAGFISVDEVQEQLGVSAATARRDLDSLAAQQLVVRTRGGAMANVSSGELPLGFKASKQGRQKSAIAEHVAAMVRPGQVIAFNGGTTTTTAAYQVGVSTANRREFALDSLTVVTNAVNIANDLTVRPNVRVVVLGGVARSCSYELIGPLTERVLSQVRIDTLFLGVDAIDPERGCFTHDDAEAAVNARLCSVSQRVIVLADSTKFRATAFAQICPLERVDMIITDSGITAEELELLGPKVTVAD